MGNMISIDMGVLFVVLLLALVGHNDNSTCPKRSCTVIVILFCQGWKAAPEPGRGREVLEASADTHQAIYELGTVRMHFDRRPRNPKCKRNRWATRGHSAANPKFHHDLLCRFLKVHENWYLWEAWGCYTLAKWPNSLENQFMCLNLILGKCASSISVATISHSGGTNRPPLQNRIQENLLWAHFILE